MPDRPTTARQLRLAAIAKHAARGGLVAFCLVQLYIVAWEVLRGNELPGRRLTSVLVVSSAVAAVLGLLYWGFSRQSRRQAYIIHSLDEVRREIHAFAEAKENAFTIALIHGQLTTVSTKLDAAVARLDELVSDAYVDGLAGRQMRDWNEPKTASITPQVNGLRLNGRS